MNCLDRLRSRAHVRLILVSVSLPVIVRLNCLLVPVDFTRFSQTVNHSALYFAEQFRAKVTLLNVVEPAVYPTEVGMVPIEIESLHRSMQNSAREKLASLAAERIPAPFRSNALVRVGRPHKEITSIAKDLKVDL